MNYSIDKSKILAIIKVCKQWRHYIESTTYCITIITNHANLQQFLIDKALNQRKTQW